MTLTEALTADFASREARGITFLPAHECAEAPKVRHLPIWNRIYESATATWMSLDSPVAERTSSFQVTLLTFLIEPADMTFTARTALGKKLWMLRQRAIGSGMRLLSEDEVLQEVQRRRGELDSDETNVC